MKGKKMKDVQLTFDFDEDGINVKKSVDDFCYFCNKKTTKYFKDDWYRCGTCNKPLWQEQNKKSMEHLC